MLANKKAQVITGDIFIALGIFIVILISVILSWDFITRKIASDKEQTEMDITARNAMASLMTTPGKPIYWHTLSDTDFNESSINSTGLTVTYPSILHAEKVIRFVELGNESNKYNLTKKILGIRKFDYSLEFYISHNVTSFPKNSTFKTGKDPVNADRISIINRYGFYNKNKTRVTIKIWK